MTCRHCARPIFRYQLAPRWVPTGWLHVQVWFGPDQHDAEPV